MAVERVSGGSSLIDVLDRVLDKGIVIDAWVRISLVGIDLITVEARVVVASIDTYLKYADAVGLTGLVSRLTLGEGGAEGEAEGELGEVRPRWESRRFTTGCASRRCLIGWNRSSSRCSMKPTSDIDEGDRRRMPCAKFGRRFRAVGSGSWTPI